MSKQYTYGSVRSFNREEALDTRVIPFTISSDARDRHRSRINMDGWELKNFILNPIVGYQHNVYGGNMCTPDDPDDVIGSGVDIKLVEEDGRKLLVSNVKFESGDINPKAEKIFRKVLAGTLRATSVGFLEVGKGENKKEKDLSGNEIETYYFKGQELLEFSIVNIPSNPEAVGRSIGVQKDWALAYLMRYMPENISIRDLKQMKVQDVLDLVEGKVQEKTIEQAVETIEKNTKERLAMRMAIMKHELKIN
jgi:hypothetical protein